MIHRRASWAATERLIRFVPQYSKLSAIRFEEVAVAEIASLARFVNDSRAQFAKTVIEAMLEKQLRLFEPLIISTNAGLRLVVPPVVERHDDQWILVDGTHRIWNARRLELDAVYVVTVTGVGLSLPSAVVGWETVTKRADHYTTEENLTNFNRALFRPVTTTFNGPAALVDD